MSLEVINAGLMSLLQDRGRFGYMHYGITNSGAINEYAYNWVNKLLGNSWDSAAVEITMGGALFKAHSDMIIAVVACAVPFSINGKACPINCTHHIQAGDMLSFGMCKKGLRIYLGVRGGFTIDSSFGAVATDMKNSIGGLTAGKALQKGDMLPLSLNSTGKDSHIRYKIPHRYKIQDEEVLVLRVILGYQQHLFSQLDKERFFNTTYEVSNASDRMGYRLIGEPMSCGQTHLISEGISYGAIQIPQDGQPIILLNDRQTIGGYPKIGSLFSLDVAKLSEKRAGGRISFVPFDIEQAKKRLQYYLTLFL